VVTVHGSHLDSVAEPRITLTVVISRSINGGTLQYRSRRQLIDDGKSILYPINTDSQVLLLLLLLLLLLSTALIPSVDPK